MAASSARWLVWRRPGRGEDVFLLGWGELVGGWMDGWERNWGGMKPFVAGTEVYAYACEGDCFAITEGAAVGVDADGFGLREA